MPTENAPTSSTLTPSCAVGVDYQPEREAGAIGENPRFRGRRRTEAAIRTSMRAASIRRFAGIGRIGRGNDDQALILLPVAGDRRGRNCKVSARIASVR